MKSTVQEPRNISIRIIIVTLPCLLLASLTGYHILIFGVCLCEIMPCCTKSSIALGVFSSLRVSGHYSNPKPLKTFVREVLWAAWLGDVIQVQRILLPDLMEVLQG